MDMDENYMDESMQSALQDVVKELDRELDRIGLYSNGQPVEISVVVPAGTASNLDPDEPGTLLRDDLKEGRSMVMLSLTRLISEDIAFSQRVLDPVTERLERDMDAEFSSEDEVLQKVLKESLDDGWEI